MILAYPLTMNEGLSEGLYEFVSVSDPAWDGAKTGGQRGGRGCAVIVGTKINNRWFYESDDVTLVHGGKL